MRIVSPLAEKDVEHYYLFIDALSDYVDHTGFIVIGNKNVGERVRLHNDKRVEFVLEDSIVSYEKIKCIITEIIDESDQKEINQNIRNDITFDVWKEKAIKRTGWYLQQFLKLGYSRLCDDEEYLLWDADTVPLHRHDMKKDDKLVFDMKKEHHEPYFDSFARIFPGLKKRNKDSYISEHMIIKTHIMREMLTEIEDRKDGEKPFYDVIMRSVNINDLPYSGFADYETYGLYCLNRYPDVYLEREWDSLRPASSFYRFGEITEDDRKWLLQDYDAMSFEAGWKYKSFIHLIMRCKFIQSHINCKRLLQILHQFTI